MRELSEYIFLGSMFLLLIEVLFFMMYTKKLLKLLTVYDSNKDSKAYQNKIDTYMSKSKKIVEFVKYLPIIFILPVIDDFFIYPDILKDQFLQHKTLICKYEDNNSNSILVDVNIDNYTVTEHNILLIVKNHQLKNKDRNITIDINRCKPKNKRWWE